MVSRITQFFLAMIIAVGIGMSACEPAHAGDGGRVAAGVAIGTLLGLGIAGAYDGPRSYARDRYYYGDGCLLVPVSATGSAAAAGTTAGANMSAVAATGAAGGQGFAIEPLNAPVARHLREQKRSEISGRLGPTSERSKCGLVPGPFAHVGRAPHTQS